MKFELNRNWLCVAEAIACLALVGCGGSSGDSIATDSADSGILQEVERRRLRRIDHSAPQVDIGPPGRIDAAGRVGLSGNVSDDRRLYQVTWSNSAGGTGTAMLNGTTTQAIWAVATLQLQAGENTITVTAEDGAGNKTTVSAVVNRDPAGPAVPPAPLPPAPLPPAPTPPAPTPPAPTPPVPTPPAPTPPAPEPAPTLPPAAAPTGTITNPILFVTQVPTLDDFASRASTFGNHRAGSQYVRRGGDLMIRYPDGSLRNLTKEAGFGAAGLTGANAIAVREPSMHWGGTKAIFSMVVDGSGSSFWQIYEVSGLGKGETVRISRVANQPNNNNVSPLYAASDDRILFTSDRARSGEAHLYPQLDEYESTPTVTGIWSLNPGTLALNILNHAPSGAFSPTIDSYGRVIFTRWDHLQRDQQAEASEWGAFNFIDESAGGAHAGQTTEMFPEPRSASTSVFGPVERHRSNLFAPWQINDDGSEEETLNHIGRQEMGIGYIPASFTSDSALSDSANTSLFANRKELRDEGGIFQIREDPTRRGTYYGIYAREFGSLSTDQIITFTGGVGVNPEQMVFNDFTVAGNSGGRFRNPLPLSDGSFVATHTPTTSASPGSMTDMRIKQLTPDGTGRYVAGPSLTGGITRSGLSGLLWELEAVEVVARNRPPRPVPALEAPEKSIFIEEAVDEAALRGWLKANDLSMIVTRNQTTRDRGDLAQPFNLQVPGGVKTVSPRGGKVYDISHFQILQADQVRGYGLRVGRRAIAQPMTGDKAKNVANPGGPSGSVRIAADGSTAAFVPARRALAWQTTDANGNPVVRERVWVTMQPGEVRVCASCHGVNTKDQAGSPAPTNKPEALRALLNHWKSLPK